MPGGRQKTQKGARKDSDDKDDADSNAGNNVANASSNAIPVTTEDIAALLDQRLEKQRKALASDFKSSFDALESKLDGMKATIENQEERVTDLEANADVVAQRLDQLEAANAKLLKENNLIQQKLSSLEGYQRRSNVRIVNLPEAILPGPRPTSFFSQLFVDVLGTDVLPSPPELSRAHRTLTTKPGLNEKPRSVIVCFHRLQVKELVMREARKRRNSLEYKGHKIRLYEDYTAEVLKHRGEYKDQMAELYKMDLRPSLLFPARLRITLPDGNKKWLQSPTEASDFIRKYMKVRRPDQTPLMEASTFDQSS